MRPAAFAGVYDGRSPVGGCDTDRLARALGGDADDVQILAWGHLALAATGEPDAGDGRCLLAGYLYEPDGRAPANGDRTESRLSARWREHGEAMLADLRGDFALLFYDHDRHEGVLARDQLGGGSLVWHHGAGRLVFASEIRHLIPLLAGRPEPDPAALGHWLASGVQRGERTLYAGVHRLEPAHLLRFGGGRNREAAPTARRYWSPRYHRPRAADATEHAAGLRSVLADAVDRRCPSRESSGILLSGGLDSSTVAALGARVDPSRRPRRAYSATFPAHPSVDEGTLVDLLCRNLDLASTRAVVRGGSVVAGAIEYLSHWQLPPPSPNLFFWLPLLRQAAADGVGALLDGEGGDELFGLSPYLLADRLRRGRVADAVDLVRRIPGGGPHLTRAAIWPYVREYGIKGAAPSWLHRAVRRRRGAVAYAPPWLRAEIAQAVYDTHDSSGWHDLDGPRWWSYLVAVTTRGLGGGVTYDHVRRRAALAGLEARHPLVDVDVVEYVLGLPPELAFEPRHSRPVLRAAMDGLVPDEVRLRPGKSNFDAVFHEALGGVDLAVTRALLAPGSAHLAAYVDLEVVADRLLSTPPPPARRQGWAIALWRLLTAEVWLRLQRGCAAPATGHARPALRLDRPHIRDRSV
ncbi:MAG: asparagine synthetase B family protein [Acidimicrobiia bacterium]